MAVARHQGIRPVTPTDITVTEGVRSLEVRWIFPGQAVTALARWFERFRAGMESREDSYLASPQLRGLSVKVRGRQALEVKVYRGSPGILEVACRARGHIESWHKWSFPCFPVSQDGAVAGWTPVHKRISWISLANGKVRMPSPGPGGEPACKVELTEIHTRDEPWWTVGLEATGPPRLLRRELELAALMVARVLPDGIDLDTDHSRSYAEWLDGRQVPKAAAPDPQSFWHTAMDALRS